MLFNHVKNFMDSCRNHFIIKILFLTKSDRLLIKLYVYYYQTFHKYMNTLYIVPTPIGNLGDITIRSLNLLKENEYIICEDTRIAKKLLNLLDVDTGNKKFISYYEPKETELTPKVLAILLENDAVFTSDSGTPLISDPGYKLLKEIRTNFKNRIKIEVLPGATSITTALVASGQPTHKFTFLGFLPTKKVKKERLFESLKDHSQILNGSYIAFESPYRVEKTLKIMGSIYKDNVTISLCRELTKKFESIKTGKPIDLLEKIDKKEIKIKGEFVLVFSFNS
ncbi:16S rRNA (cytidine(1402)-2'-O)-methyltransferase [Candidatus Dojkabacteria bacterium]|nr:16S rRNA (cytidine(1402)-2'-O)-methyltransferase [Candidatus Dojkabacteria bacterium]